MILYEKHRHPENDDQLAVGTPTGMDAFPLYLTQRNPSGAGGRAP